MAYLCTWFAELYGIAAAAAACYCCCFLYTAFGAFGIRGGCYEFLLKKKKKIPLCLIDVYLSVGLFVQSASSAHRSLFVVRVQPHTLFVRIDFYVKVKKQHIQCIRSEWRIENKKNNIRLVNEKAATQEKKFHPQKKTMNSVCWNCCEFIEFVNYIRHFVFDE